MWIKDATSKQGGDGQIEELNDACFVVKDKAGQKLAP
jgi:hypothetical protein